MIDRYRWGVNAYDSLDGTVTRVTDVPSGTRFKTSMKWTTGTAEVDATESEADIIMLHKKLKRVIVNL